MKKPSCCDTSAKILLIIFNCIFWAFGVAILGIGIWIKTDPELSNLGQAVKVGDQEPVIEIITWLFIGAGIFVFAVGVVGMIGIIRESKIMMGFYTICVFIVFAAEISAGAYAGIRKDYILEAIKDEGAQYLKTSYGINETSLISRGFNYIQVQHKCCGVISFMDYKNSSYLNSLRKRNQLKDNATLSYACCKSVTSLDDAFKGDGKLTVEALTRDKCMIESAKYTLRYEQLIADGDEEEEAVKDVQQVCKKSKTKNFICEQGCAEALVNLADDNLIIMLGIGIAVGASQLILLFLALWFCQSLGKDEK